jgi:hypothetical protein
VRNRTVRWSRIWSTSGRNTGSNAISEQVVRPALFSRAHSASSICGKSATVVAPAMSGNTAPVSSAVPSSSPASSRPYLAPFGSGVSRFRPALRPATELKKALCPELWMITNGVSGAMPSSHASDGSGSPDCSSASQPTR